MKLSIIIPTLNERNNIEILINAVSNALSKTEWEIIFVDDHSSDGTPEIIDNISAKNARVKCIKRPFPDGISSACIEGMRQSRATYIAVMDGDLQHDPRVLYQMLSYLENNDVELVIASRYVKGASIAGWPKSRILMSYSATFLSQLFIQKPVKDPLSGFFILKRSLFENNINHLYINGSKILMSFLIYSKGLHKIKEIPFDFKPRYKGLSKHNPRLIWENCLIILNIFSRRP